MTLENDLTRGFFEEWDVESLKEGEVIRKIIKSIAKKLAEKMTKEQLQIMLQEGIKKANNLETLKEIDKELDTKKPEIKGNKGCYKLEVNGKDIVLLS